MPPDAELFLARQKTIASAVAASLTGAWLEVTDQVPMLLCWRLSGAIANADNNMEIDIEQTNDDGTTVYHRATIKKITKANFPDKNKAGRELIFIKRGASTSKKPKLRYKARLTGTAPSFAGVDIWLEPYYGSGVQGGEMNYLWSTV